MKKIKFRVWDRKKKQFDTCQNGGDCICFSLDHKGIQTLSSGSFKIYQQFIGLLDKNGKEIYEGDILKGVLDEGYVLRIGYDPHEFETGEIKWDYSGYTWELYEKDKRYIHDLVLVREKEVIGNIYENPELLK